MTKNLTPRMWTGLLVAALHLALLYIMLQARGVRPADAPAATHPPIQWLKPYTPQARPPTPPPAPPRLLPPKPLPLRAKATPSTAAPGLPRNWPAPGADRAQSDTASAAPAPGAITPPAAAEAAPAAPTPSMDEIMRIAKRDVGKIDKELQKAYPQRGEVAPVDTPQTRLQRGFDAAHAAVLPKWHEGPRVEEITQGVASENRTYRFRSALGVFCYTVSGRDGRKMVHNCPN